MTERGHLMRDVLTIVATGIVLGLAYNQLALASRPPRGLAWVGGATPLESLESGGGGMPDTTVLLDTTGTGLPEQGGPFVVLGAPEAPAARGTVPAPSTPPPTKKSAPQSTPASPVALPVIPDAPRPLKIELADVKKFVDARAAVIIDARESAEFAAGRLPGAINISIDDSAREPERLEQLDPKGMPIIVYCGGGECEASRMLAESLMRDYGKKRVLVYEGGFPEWASAGYRVDR